MENLFNFIIIIISIVVFIVSSLIKTYRKQGKEAVQPEESSFFNNNDFFPDEDDIGLQNNTFSEEVTNELKEEKSMDLNVSSFADKDIAKNKETVKQKNNNQNLTTNQPISSHKNRSLQKIIKKFNARSAIIYAEIINPKYF